MSRMWRVGLALAAYLFAVGAGAQSNVEMAVGDTKLQFPADPGYVSARNKAPQVYETMSVAIPKSMRLLDVFFTEDDIKRSLLGLGRPEQTIYSVQVLRDLESMAISDTEWAAGKPAMARDIGDLDLNTLKNQAARESSKRLSEFSGKDIDIRLGKTKRPQVYNTEGDTIRFLMLLPYKGQSGSVDIEETLVAAGAIVRIREKLIYVYLFHRREDEGSAPALQAQLDEFLPRFFKANVPVEAPVTPADATAGTVRGATLPAPGRALVGGRTAAE